MITLDLFPIPIRVADGGPVDLPLEPRIAQGPPRYAQVSCTNLADVSGHLTYKAPHIPFDGGWLDVVFTMGLYGDEPEAWRCLCWRQGHIGTGLPWLGKQELVTAWITRDAVGWTIGKRQKVETTKDEGGQPFWPWMWLRPYVSAHQHVQRVQRLLNDAQWMAHTTMKRQTF